MSDERQDIEARLGLGPGGHRRRYLWALAALLMLGLGAWWWLQGQDESRKGPLFATTLVLRGDLTVTVTATGTVEPTNVVDISSELSGTLAEVLVDFNDTVAEGQLLARLDTSTLEAQVAVRRASLRAAIASVSRAEASLDEAQTNYDNARQLYERGVGSNTAYITAAAVLARARADLEVAQADVELAEANLEAAETELGKACICSPIDGVVLNREADTGQIVATSLQASTLFTIAEDLSSMELQVAVDEADIGRLAIGNPATFTVDAYDERTFPAVIATIRYAPTTLDGVVTYIATLEVDNTDLALRPGMTATAEIVVNEITDALLIPNAARRFQPRQAAEASGGGGGLLGLILPRPPGGASVAGATNTVWVLRGGAAVEVEIEPGDSDGSHTEIRGGELSEGDLVITRQLGET